MRANRKKKDLEKKDDTCEICGALLTSHFCKKCSMNEEEAKVFLKSKESVRKGRTIGEIVKLAQK
jgi:hypothetical protein